MGIFDSFKKKKPEEKSEEIRRQTCPLRENLVPGKWLIGDKIMGRYEVLDIKQGGMGIVYICYDLEFKEVVVLKTFRDKFLKDHAAINLFKREAETWVRLDKHHNIVQVKYFWPIELRPFVILEYVEGDKRYGVDLSGWIYNGGLGPLGQPDIPLILNFTIQFGHGMIYAEKKYREMGKLFVHRDIKPSNILITQDKMVKITDFGLVKIFAELNMDIPTTMVGEGIHQRSSLSKSGTICGTPPYMSPEQCRGEKDISVRSDIYSFGCVLYEMLIHKYVFEARTSDELIYHHLRSQPIIPKMHPKLGAVLSNCLEKRPIDRKYRNFEELEDVLSSIYLELTGLKVMEPEVKPTETWELINRGASLANLRFNEEALNYLLKAVQMNPKSVVAHYNLGWVFKNQNNFDAAIVELLECLKLDPNRPDARFELALTLEEKGQYGDAMKQWEKYLEVAREIPSQQFWIPIAQQHIKEIENRLH